MGGDLVDEQMLSEIESLSERSFNIDKLQKDYFKDSEK